MNADDLVAILTLIGLVLCIVLLFLAIYLTTNCRGVC
jgi:hypothetical protein